jgi:hypothetical protein
MTMGLFSDLILLPLLPLRGTVWVAEQLTEEAERQLADQHDPRRVLARLSDARDRGEISAQDFDQAEEDLLRQIVGPAVRLGRGHGASEQDWSDE